MLKKTNLCCFSPTGGTRHMGELFCQDISEEMTVTDLLKREENPQQPDSDLTVIAAPVFGGRIPSTAAEIAGIEKRVGTLTPGKDADIVVTAGHPFDWNGRIKAVFIDGKQVR